MDQLLQIHAYGHNENRKNTVAVKATFVMASLHMIGQ